MALNRRHFNWFGCLLDIVQWQVDSVDNGLAEFRGAR